MTLYFEDINEGDTAELGTYEVTEAEVLSFAEQYDPQWFHTDPERAREESMYGGLIASGWHTAAMTMRMLVDGYLAEAATLGAKGVDELRWWRPVRPGDTLSATVDVERTVRESPERGLVSARVSTTNQDDTEVFSMVGQVLFAARDAADGGD